MIRDFLDKLVPQGLRIIHTTNKTADKHLPIVCGNSGEMLSAINRFKDDGKTDIYFALGSIKQARIDGKLKGTRAIPNIQGLKCFWIDIDCEEGKDGKYPSHVEADEALRDFICDYDMPQPMVVFSGKGLHVYWPLVKPVLKESWKPLAERLKDGLLEIGLKFDSALTANPSCVLRVPGTFNIKRGTKVSVMCDCDPIDLKVMKEAILRLPVSKAKIPATQSASLPGIEGTSVEVGLDSNTDRKFPPCEFDEVLEKCAQVDNLYQTGGKDEPHWYAGIALARHMTDPEDAAIAMSEAHADYSRSITLRKLWQSTKEITGPTTCKRFQQCGPAGLCEGCPKFGKISTPAQLGQPERAVTEFRKQPTVTITPIGDIEIPRGYFRTDNEYGASVMHESKDGKSSLVHVGNIFPIARLEDTRTGDSHITWTLTAPRKNDFNVVIPQAIMADPKALDTLLNSKGVTVHNITKLKAFMSAYIHQLQKITKPKKLIGQLGWNTTHTSFTLAPVEYHNDGSVETHEVSDAFRDAMPGIVQKGTLEGWVEGMEFYNSPGHEAHQLMICGAFGSPLYHMTGHKGALVFASGESGTGKTTVLKAMNSVWGHPVDLLLNGTKSGMTANARTTKFGMYRNISMCMDEITNWTGPQFSALALEITQGEGKSRSNQNGTLSKILADWAFIGFGSSNSDAYDMIQSAKGAAGAESMRVFQLHMTLPTSHTKDEANRYSNITQDQNYGHAGHVFIQYVVEHYDEIKEDIHKMINFLTARLGSETQERFWVSILATSLVAGSIAKKLGLISFDVQKCVHWGGKQLQSTRTRVKDSIRTPEVILSEFLDKYSRETLRLDATPTPKVANSNKSLWEEGMPTGSIFVRVEDYTTHHLAYITKSVLKDHCKAAGVNFTEMESVLVSNAVILNKQAKKVLGAGTTKAGGQVWCWEVDMTKL